MKKTMAIALTGAALAGGVAVFKQATQHAGVVVPMPHVCLRPGEPPIPCP